MKLIELKQVSISYDHGNQAVQNVSFSVESGDYLCIVGENGSGKSTLIKGLLGLQPLQAGTVRFIPPMSRDQIGYLPQKVQVQRDFPASVREVVLSGCLRRGLFYSRADKQTAAENMQLLNIFQLRDQSYREPSGGQQQRVLLARALCAAGKMLVLDEPVTGLDPVVTQELYALLKKLNRSRDLTIVMVSHDIAAAVQYANKILHMDQTVRFFGTTQDYLQSDIGKTFLGRGRPQ